MPFLNSCPHFERLVELSEKVKKGGGESAIIRHTQKNRKVLVRDRVRLLLDDEDFFELSPFAGLGLPYGDIASAGCLTGQKPQAPVLFFRPLNLTISEGLLVTDFQILTIYPYLYYDAAADLYMFHTVSNRYWQDQWPVVCGYS